MSKNNNVTIGVLGFQGDIEENVAATRQALDELKIDGKIQLVRYAEDVEKIDALILPGGESTVQSSLAAIQRSLPALKKRIAEGMPVLGTCAGMIMLSKRAFDHVVGETKQKTIGNLDIVIERNAFGRQNDSFETDLKMDMLGKDAFRGVFIRAPAVSEVGKDVEVIARHAGKIVAVKQKNIIGTSFHPELAGDARMHKQIVKMAVEFKRGK
ncbi:pyridoxal 5'-phosphate synthase glutaminase subunit PdxT [Nitrososphaera viennensis]|mgnify:CR=1 FL=1|uniref:Pyridoxal 5'-phosphate synthase subunit PdxT n=2 Tax=Nitrososphaera viennensis TaxID=1034015 RepID=A0A060HQ20_9ARCH|nr:pyridoxal 5'-phosphate synthase glutaminase subunit PdxT [Nitrososphaera viennensis]AIC17220.1 glutamine amidotransferase subunit PdxT [Nitrososphaera viennensis EN76]UVS69107.1 pyridoxal 5'-phosphate synthase glutaminase subunit PdxT [Nitrososphaera viennensis]